MNYIMKIRLLIATVTMLFVCQDVSAQSGNSMPSPYSFQVSRHPSHCSTDYEFGGSFYGGLMMSQTSGSIAGDHYLGGLDIGIKLTNMWGYTCQPVKFELNAYVDIKAATYLSTSDDSDGSFTLGDTPTVNEDYTDYAAQLSITPGIKWGRFSIDCGPYIAYAAYTDDIDLEEFGEIFSSAKVSGFDFGIRMGAAVHFEKIQIGLHYDIGITDHDKRFKKNDLMLTIGSQF